MSKIYRKMCYCLQYVYSLKSLQKNVLMPSVYISKIYRKMCCSLQYVSFKKCAIAFSMFPKIYEKMC